MKLLIFLFCLTMSIITHAQLNVDWARSASTSGDDNMDDMAIDYENSTIYSVYLESKIGAIKNGGQTIFSDTADYQQIMLFKLDSIGNLLWTYRIDAGWFGHGNSVSIDKSNNIYVYGTFEGTVDFDNDTSVYSLSVDSTIAIVSHFILKLDPNGNFVWVRQVSVSNTYHFGIDKVVVTDNNDLILAGQNDGLADFDPDTGIVGSPGYHDMYILKLDSTGKFMWVKEFGSGITLKSLTINNNGDITFTGYMQYATDFDPDSGVVTITPSDFEDAFICQLDSNGSFKWANLIPTYAIDITSLMSDSSNNLYLFGSASGLTDFNVNNPSLNSQITDSTKKLFYVKYDANGNFLWLNVLGYWEIFTPRAAATDSGGFGYLSVSYWYGIQSYRIRIFKVSPHGNLYWTKDYNSSHATVTYFTSLELDEKGKLYGAGEFSGNLFGQVGDGNRSGFMISFSDTTVGLVERTSTLIDIFLYPNPGKEQFTVSLSKNINLIELEVYNSVGKLLKRSKEKRISMSGFPPGLYIVKVQTHTGKKVLRFIKD